MHEESYDELVGRIYDCAIDPLLWPQTLDAIRSNLDAAYVLVGFVDHSRHGIGQLSKSFRWHSPWDVHWLDDLVDRLPQIPGIQSLTQNGIDHCWTQMTQLPEAEFRKSPFYREWVAPHDLLPT